jgi:hypothetical protein
MRLYTAAWQFGTDVPSAERRDRSTSPDIIAVYWVFHISTEAYQSHDHREGPVCVAGADGLT